MAAAPRPQAVPLLLLALLAAPARGLGLGGCGPEGCREAVHASVHAGLAAHTRRLQAGLASGLQRLQGRASGTGLGERLAGLRGPLAQECEHWGRKVRESWQDGLALLANATRDAGDDEPRPWPFCVSWDCWEPVRANLTSARQRLQEELSLMTAGLQDRFVQAQANLSSTLQTLLGGLSSGNYAIHDKLAWLNGRFDEESGYWDQKFRDSWRVAADSWNGKRHRTEDDTNTSSEESRDWRRELRFAREGLRSWRGEAVRAQRRAGKLEGELGGAKEELSTHRTAHEQEARMLRETLRWELRVREDEAGHKRQCEERLAKEKKVRDGEAAHAWGCLCVCVLLVRLLAPRCRGLAGARCRVASWCGSNSSAQATQDEFDSKFPSDVRDEAQADGLRLRVLEIRCRGVQHEDISVEAICNGCVVAITQKDAAGGQPAARSRLFQWQLSEGLFSLADELASFEDGVIHLVLRESLPQGRAVRLPQHFSLEDEDTCSDSSWLGQESEVSGDHPPEDAASLDGFEASFEQVEQASDGPSLSSDGEEGAHQGRPDRGHP